MTDSVVDDETRERRETERQRKKEKYGEIDKNIYICIIMKSNLK